MNPAALRTCKTAGRKSAAWRSEVVIPDRLLLPVTEVLGRQQIYKMVLPRHMTEIKGVPAGASSSFITLSVGRSACERFLKGADTETLKWVRMNANLATQASTIDEQYLRGKQDGSPPLVTRSHEVVDEPETRLPEPATSASLWSEPNTGSHEHSAQDNEVSLSPIFLCWVGGGKRKAGSRRSPLDNGTTSSSTEACIEIEPRECKQS